MQIIQLQNQSRPLTQPISASYCDTFWSRFRGLMFQSKLEPTQALLLVDKKDNRLDLAIHMLFMNFDITAVWINSQKKVVDVKLARKGQLNLNSTTTCLFCIRGSFQPIFEFSNWRFNPFLVCTNQFSLYCSSFYSSQLFRYTPKANPIYRSISFNLETPWGRLHKDLASL